MDGFIAMFCSNSSKISSPVSEMFLSVCLKATRSSLSRASGVCGDGEEAVEAVLVRLSKEGEEGDAVLGIVQQVRRDHLQCLLKDHIHDLLNLRCI